MNQDGEKAVVVGLRQREKQAAMRHIQHTASALFEEKSFDNVTAEQVTEAADVSQSSAYRYFGTKEGLMFRDEYDDAAFGMILAEFESGAAILGASDKGIGGAIEEHFYHDHDIALARTKLRASHEGIRAVVGPYLMRLSERMVEAVVTGGRYDEIEARFITACLSYISPSPRDRLRRSS